VTNQTIILSRMSGFSLQIFLEEFAEAIELEWMNFDSCFKKCFESEEAKEDRSGKMVGVDSIEEVGKNWFGLASFHEIPRLQHLIWEFLYYLVEILC
jgi:hypothetical protein